MRGCRPGSWPVVASLDGHLIPLPSSDRRFEEHEREQRERLVGAGEPGQVGERPSAHPRVAATENHGDDQQQRGEQRAEQQGQHQKMTPTTIGRIRFRSCTEASCTCPASRWTVHRDARRRRGPRHRGADRGDGVERRRGRSMRARISSVPLGWVFVTRVGRHECGGPTARGRGPRCSPSSLGRGDRWKRPGRTTARAAARSDIAVHAASHRRRVHTHLGPCSGR